MIFFDDLIFHKIFIFSKTPSIFHKLIIPKYLTASYRNWSFNDSQYKSTRQMAYHSSQYFVAKVFLVFARPQTVSSTCCETGGMLFRLTKAFGHP